MSALLQLDLAWSAFGTDGAEVLADTLEGKIRSYFD